MPTPPGENISQRLIAACLAALFTVLLVNGAGQFGFIGSFIYLVVAVPVGYVFMRFTFPSAIGAVVLSALVLFGMYGVSNPLLEYLLLFATPSLLLPFFLRSGWRWDQAAALTVVVMIVLAGSIAAAVALNEGTTVSAFADRYVQTQMELVRDTFAPPPDLSPEQQRQLRQFIRDLEEWLQQIYPAIVVLGMAAFVLMQLWCLSLLAGRHYILPGVSFVDWKTPERLIWVLIAAGMIVFAASGLIRQLGLNLLIVLLLVYYVQGLAIITTLFKRKHVPVFLRIPGYMMTLFLNPLPIIVAGIGVFDLWIDFRKKRIKGNEPF